MEIHSDHTYSSIAYLIILSCGFGADWYIQGLNWGLVGFLLVAILLIYNNIIFSGKIEIIDQDLIIIRNFLWVEKTKSIPINKISTLKIILPFKVRGIKIILTNKSETEILIRAKKNILIEFGEYLEKEFSINVELESYFRTTKLNEHEPANSRRG